MYLFLKRLFYLTLSFISLFFLFPFFLIISIILFFTGEGEVFYLQERIGYKNKKFKDEVQIPLIMKLIIYLYALVLKIKGRGITNFLPK